jgi:DNA transformation protein
VTDREILDHVLAGLLPLGVRSRAMFGGHGLYAGHKFFGLVNDGRLYFRTDDASRPAYLARGMQPFQPNRRPIGPRTVPRNYQVPPEIISDPEALLAWAIRATQAP